MAMPTSKDLQDALSLSHPDAVVELWLDTRQHCGDEKPVETMVVNLKSRTKIVLKYIARY